MTVIVSSTLFYVLVCLHSSTKLYVIVLCTGKPLESYMTLSIVNCLRRGRGPLKMKFLDDSEVVCSSFNGPTVSYRR